MTDKSIEDALVSLRGMKMTDQSIEDALTSLTVPIEYFKKQYTEISEECLKLTSAEAKQWLEECLKLTSAEAKQWLESRMPELKSDVYFQQLFGVCFTIEQNRQKSKK